MDKKKQLWLPKLRKVKRIKKKRQAPQPRIRGYRIVKKYELLHRPFDLRFRGKLNKWLEGLQQEDDFVENRDGDEQGHIRSIGRLGDRLPVDGEAEHVDERRPGDRQGENVTDEDVFESRHGVAA